MALTRTKRGMSLGMMLRARSVSSTPKRVRFSKLPPYLSLRWLATGERNSWRR